MQKIEIVSGATCTDSECPHFEADAHPCEEQGHEHAATHTVTHDDVAVFFLCVEGVEGFVRRNLAHEMQEKEQDPNNDGTPYGTGGDWCAWCGADWKAEHAVNCPRPVEQAPDLVQEAHDRHQREVRMADTLGPCGCVDYHMADCPTRTAAMDQETQSDYDAWYDQDR